MRWFDRTGKELGVIGEASSYSDVRLSPDGAKLAFSAGDPYADIWVDELARGSACASQTILVLTTA